MVGWHHQLNAYEFEQTLGDSGVQRCLVGYSPRGRKESDTTQWLNSNNNPETSAFYQLRSFDLQKMTAPTSKNPKHRGIAKICICPWSKQEAGLRGCSNRPCFHSLPIYICSLKFQILKKKKKRILQARVKVHSQTHQLWSWGSPEALVQLLVVPRKGRMILCRASTHKTPACHRHFH